MNFLNSTVEYSVSNSWGYQDAKTGQWTGLMEDLVDKGYELGATPLFITLERVDLVEYISMPSPTRSKFVFKSPKLSYTDNVFLLPFDQFVWFSSAGLVLISSILLLGAVYIESNVLKEGNQVWNYIYKKHKNILSFLYIYILQSDSGLLRPSIGNTLMLVFGATCQQGSSVVPRSPPARIITLVSFIALMFLYTRFVIKIVLIFK